MIKVKNHFIKNQNKYMATIILIASQLTPQNQQQLGELLQQYNQQKLNQSTSQISPNTGSQLNDMPEKSQMIPFNNLIDTNDNSNSPLINNKINFFGYDFFEKIDLIDFWDNLPPPVSYLLGPGDELVISLWGETQLRKNYTISRDGKIYDDKVGLLVLTGKSIKEAENYLKSQFGRVYSTLNGNEPSTFIDVSLGEMQSINVNFVGHVKFPGIYPLHPFSSIITGLMQAGGVDTTGSLRSIEIIRNNDEVNKLDLYQFFVNGDLPSSAQLRDQDIIIVPPRNSRIVVDSAVVRPGIYELVEGETVFDLINLAGGRTYNASNIVGISSIVPEDKRNLYNSAFSASYVKFSDTKNITAYSGDIISVNFLKNELMQVEISGQVKSPGKYHFYQGMMLSELIDISGGFEDTTFWKSVYKERAEIVRRKDSQRYEDIIQVNLVDLINEKIDYKLESLDRIVIHANLNFFEKKHIKIAGEVKVPGDYPMIRDGESLLSIINRAGGFTENSFQDGIEIYRDTLRVVWNNLSISLFPGDSIIINQKPGTVEVAGEVYNPGLIEFDKFKSLSYYVESAGGLTKIGDKNDIIVIYPNGEVKPKTRFSSPTIKEGSKIIINEKVVNPSFSIADFANTSLSLISSVVTILVLAQQISSN